MRSLSFAPVTLAVMALLHGAPSWAGANGAQLAVGITLSRAAGPGAGGATTVSTTGSRAQLSPPSGVCRSRTLSESTGAAVEVACRSGQFVSIAPEPGARFFGVHGGAFRYSITFHTELSMWDSVAIGDPPGLGWGTVTALRLYDLAPPQGPQDGGWDGPLEMLVSF
jgi:hypothetical protein